jgi:amidohydrolase
MQGKRAAAASAGDSEMALFISRARNGECEMQITSDTIAEYADQVIDDVIKWRRYLHQNPELSFHEVNTAQFVFDTLQSFGELELSRPTRTSVMARLIGPNPGKTLALRADMDALPITEETGLPFASQNPGVMHACGHDGHTAILLGTAKILAGMKEQINGEVRFLFQHGEEQFPGGAQEMVKAGCMDGVDMVIGLHLDSQRETGQIALLSGPYYAAPDSFEITVIGKGGHAAYPHETVDSVAVAAQVITNLQQIVSRTTNPLDSLVLSVSTIAGGQAHNVIPGKVTMTGTVRSFQPAFRQSVPERMEAVIRGVTAAHGASYEFRYTRGYDPVINDEKLTNLVRATLVSVFGEEALPPVERQMGGEDFSAYLQKAPGTFFDIGAGNVAKGIVAPHHHPRFTIDEDALLIGVKAFVNIAYNLLNRKD